MSPTTAPTLPQPTRMDLSTLMKEAERYLSVVDLFRAEGRALEWRLERPDPSRKDNS